MKHFIDDCCNACHAGFNPVSRAADKKDCSLAPITSHPGLRAGIQSAAHDTSVNLCVLCGHYVSLISEIRVICGFLFSQNKPNLQRREITLSPLVL